MYYIMLLVAVKLIQLSNFLYLTSQGPLLYHFSVYLGGNSLKKEHTFLLI